MSQDPPDFMLFSVEVANKIDAALKAHATKGEILCKCGGTIYWHGGKHRGARGGSWFVGKCDACDWQARS